MTDIVKVGVSRRDVDFDRRGKEPKDVVLVIERAGDRSQGSTDKTRGLLSGFPKKE